MVFRQTSYVVSIGLLALLLGAAPGSASEVPAAAPAPAVELQLLAALPEIFGGARACTQTPESEPLPSEPGILPGEEEESEETEDGPGYRACKTNGNGCSSSNYCIGLNTGDACYFPSGRVGTCHSIGGGCCGCS
jgi:hypothetical protein